MSNFYIPKYDCVFMHIPKTAGGAIRNLFFRKEFIGPFFDMPNKYLDKFSFCFVRNPYDRIISAYKYINREFSNHQISFDEFLNIATDESIPFHVKGLRQNYKIFIRHHTMPQTHEYLCLQYVKFIGRYENLQKDWRVICKKIGSEYYPLPYDLEKNTKEKISYVEKIYAFLFPASYKKSYYKKYFNKERLEKINKFFSKDFEVLGYKKIKDLS